MASSNARKLERDRKSSLAYYHRNREARLAYAKKFRERNRESYNLSRRVQRRDIRYRYSILCWNAKRRNISVDLTFEEFKSLVENRSCKYCSGPLPEAGAGLDRLDNRLGYSFSNCVPCCGAEGNDCNGKKGALEMIGFIFPRTVELMEELLHGHK